jgi:hypothetical protein
MKFWHATVKIRPCNWHGWDWQPAIFVGVCVYCIVSQRGVLTFGAANK